MELAFDQSDVPRARSLLRVLGSELDALTFTQQLEHRPPHRAAVEEMLDTALVADESEPFVDEEACDCPGRHTRSPPFRTPQGHPQGNSAGYERLRARKPSGR